MKLIQLKYSYLVYFKVSNESIVYPRECCFKWRYSKLVEMVAHFWFVHLQEVFEQLREADYRLRVARQSVQVTPILTVKCSEDEVAIFFFV